MLFTKFMIYYRKHNIRGLNTNISY